MDTAPLFLHKSDLKTCPEICKCAEQWESAQVPMQCSTVEVLLKLIPSHRLCRCGLNSYSSRCFKGPLWIVTKPKHYRSNIVPWPDSKVWCNILQISLFPDVFFTSPLSLRLVQTSDFLPHGKLNVCWEIWNSLSRRVRRVAPGPC